MLAAVAVAAFAAIAPSAWVDAKRAMRADLDSLDDFVGPAAQRAADWLGAGVGTVRDALAQGTAGATVSGPARVVDGDTLEVRGTRVRLHGIDAPESKQRCRSAGRTWPCGYEATQVLSDGLACFNGVTAAGCVHEPMVTGGGKAAVERPEFRWVNTILGNIKNALCGTYHAVRPKYAQRYLAEFEYRFNRRFDLPDIIPRLVYVALRTPPMPERLLKLRLA